MVLPAGVFSPLAEQVRWDAFRMGCLQAADWVCARAHLEPVFAEEAKAGEFAFAVTLIGSAKPVRLVARPSDVQGIRLFLASGSGLGNQPASVAVFWDLEAPLPIPLSRLILPTKERVRKPFSSQLAPMHWRVSADVRHFLAAVADKSLTEGTELGGALLGRVCSPDELIIESAVAAAGSGGSSASFRFSPGFWARLVETGLHGGQRVVGWFHSHLCDEGHPEGLSHTDLRIMYRHFAAPWLMTALVCVSRQGSQVQWYNWEGGAVVRRTEANPAFFISGNDPRSEP